MLKRLHIVRMCDIHWCRFYVTRKIIRIEGLPFRSALPSRLSGRLAVFSTAKEVREKWTIEFRCDFPEFYTDFWLSCVGKINCRCVLAKRKGDKKAKERGRRGTQKHTHTRTNTSARQQLR